MSLGQRLGAMSMTVKMNSLLASAAAAAVLSLNCIGASPAKPDFTDAGTGGASSGTGGASSGSGGASSSSGGATGSGSGGNVGGGGPNPNGGRGGTSAPGSGGAASGSGGAPTGTGGAAQPGTGGQGGAVVVAPDLCSGADPGNDDRDHATPYPTLGVDFQACMQTATDVDFYQFTTPAAPAGGGVVTVSLINVGPNGNIEMQVYVVADNGQLVNAAVGGAGVSDYLWFNATASTMYRVAVNRFTSGPTANPYTFKAVYTPVNDTHEVNDLRTQASPLTVATPVQGYMFGGYTVSTGFANNAWEDWYRVTLAAGTVTITLEILANDINGEIELFNGLGTSIDSEAVAAAGSSVVLNHTTALTAGDYFVKVSPFTIPNSKNSNNIIPQYALQPYTLTVTQ